MLPWGLGRRGARARDARPSAFTSRGSQPLAAAAQEPAEFLLGALNLTQPLGALRSGQAAPVDARDPAHGVDVAAPDAAAARVVLGRGLSWSMLALHRVGHEHVAGAGRVALGVCEARPQAHGNDEAEAVRGHHLRRLLGRGTVGEQRVERGGVAGVRMRSSMPGSRKAGDLGQSLEVVPVGPALGASSRKATSIG